MSIVTISNTALLLYILDVSIAGFFSPVSYTPPSPVSDVYGCNLLCVSPRWPMLHGYHLYAHHWVCLTAKEFWFVVRTHCLYHKDKTVSSSTNVIYEASVTNKLRSSKH